MPLIADKYLSYQGSGHLIGKRQFFIRFAGCGVKCPIRDVCDEPFSLKRDNGIEFSSESLADEALESVGKYGWVHITGGEPCEQSKELQQLGISCERRNLRVHLSTSGMIQVPIRTDWLTISPKSYAESLCWNRSRWANEMIVVYDPRWIIDSGVLRAFEYLTKCYDYYLQPLSHPDGTTNIESTLETLDRLNDRESCWDLTIQMHKLIGVK